MEFIHTYITQKSVLLYARNFFLIPVASLSKSGDENVHLIRNLLDEVFGRENACSLITYAKTTTTTGRLLPGTNDFILWYAKDAKRVKFRQLHGTKTVGGASASNYSSVEEFSGFRRSMSPQEKNDPASLSSELRPFRLDNLTSPRIREARTGFYPIAFKGKDFLPRTGEWKTNREGMSRLLQSNRIDSTGEGVYYIRYIEDFPAFLLNNSWSDTAVAGFASQKVYVVQTLCKGGSTMHVNDDRPRRTSARTSQRAEVELTALSSPPMGSSLDHN